jgi:hypothetical protein
LVRSIHHCGALFLAACAFFLCATLPTRFVIPASAEEQNPIHGLWLWKGPSILEEPGTVESLRVFCHAQGINEVYVSVSQHDQMMAESSMAKMIAVLHQAHIRVEALLSSENADEGNRHLDKLLDRVQTIVQFNRHHSGERFDGIHLDIEPQQRPENKGSGNLRFLPGLVEAYRKVRAMAEPAGLTVNADIQNKLLKGSLDERRMLLSALPRLTLMMYELSSPDDGTSVEQKRQKVRESSQRFLQMAYAGLNDPRLAKMVIGLRTPDYEKLMPVMLQTLDEANHADPHYLGWAWHSYNDSSQTDQ